MNHLNEYKLCVALQNFLHLNNIWIWRQIEDAIVRPDMIIYEISYMTNKSHPNLHQLKKRSYRIKAFKKKLFFIFKYLTPGLSFIQARQVRKILKTNNINLLHAHFGTVGVNYYKIARDLNIPFLVTFHGFDIYKVPLRYPGYNKALLGLFRNIKIAVAISEVMKEKLIDLGCPPDKIRRSYLGVPTNDFGYLDRSNRNGKLRFLHMGRLTAKKGIIDLIKVFAEVFRENENVELMVAGNGEEFEQIQQLITRLQVEEKVRLLGNIEPDEVPRHYKDADVFVLNSRIDDAGNSEGLPISILEASATGLPVISTFHAGIPEAVIHEKTGLLVKERDNEALGKALLRMMDRKIRLDYGRRGYELMKEKFDIRKCNRRLKEIYQEAIST